MWCEAQRRGPRAGIPCRAGMVKSWCGDLGGLPTRDSLVGFVDEHGLYLIG